MARSISVGVATPGTIGTLRNSEWSITGGFVPWGHQECGAGVDRTVGLFLGQHSAGTYEQVAALGEAADRLFGRIGAESDLGNREPACNQRVAEAIGVVGIVHDDHRHQSQAAELFQHFVHCAPF